MISGQVIQALPRPIADFLTGAFGPLSPLSPIGIDAPPEGSERPEPRRFQYPIGWNMPLGQPGTEGLKLATFANLRQYADVYSIVRACIQLRKDEILRLEWNVVPTEQAEKEMRGDVKAYEDFQSRRAEALAFFARPDRRWHGYHSWMSAMLEDFFVCDALTLYLHPSRKKGKGLLGSDLGALETLDGTTIRPLLDIRGGTPQPPAPAYQQYLWGVPRSDFLDIILNTDVEEMDEPVDQYRADQLLYLPYVTRNWTPYGFPGVERALIPVITGLKRQTWALEYFCYSDDTEILTREGWRKFPELRGDEEYATRSPAGQFEWQRGKDDAVYAFDYDDELVRFQSDDVDALVTPNHRMLVQRSDESHTTITLAEKIELLSADERAQLRFLVPDGAQNERLTVVPLPQRQWYSGRVYCVSVPNTVVLVRRNGKAMWCGQTEGSIPGLFIIPGPDVSTAQQIRTLQDSLNALANDTGYRHKIIVLPPGS